MIYFNLVKKLGDSVEYKDESMDIHIQLDKIQGETPSAGLRKLEILIQRINMLNMKVHGKGEK